MLLETIKPELQTPTDEPLVIPSVNDWRWRVLCELDNHTDYLDRSNPESISHIFDDILRSTGSIVQIPYLELHNDQEQKADENKTQTNPDSFIKVSSYFGEAMPVIQRTYRDEQEQHTSRNLRVELPKPRTFIERLGKVARVGTVKTKLDANNSTYRSLENIGLTPRFIRLKLKPELLGHIIALTQSRQLYEIQHTNPSVSGKILQETTPDTAAISSYRHMIDKAAGLSAEETRELANRYVQTLVQSGKSLKIISGEINEIVKLSDILEQIDFSTI